MESNYIHEDVPGGVPLKMWTRGVPIEDEAKRQLTNAARLPIVFKHIEPVPVQWTPRSHDERYPRTAGSVACDEPGTGRRWVTRCHSLLRRPRLCV